MFSVPSTSHGVRSHPEDGRRRPPNPGLFPDGKMAVLADDRDYGHRYQSEFSSRSERSAHEHLAALLRPLHSDPEDLSRRLLNQFGSISSITHADEIELRNFASHSDTWIDSFLVVRQLCLDGLREKALRSRLDSKDREFRAYLFASLRGLRTERLVAVFGDEAGRVIREEVLAEGDAGSVSLSPRLIFQRALALNSRRFVLAHNHPSGSCSASNSDIEQTKKLVSQAADLGIFLEDHLIIGKHAIFSMREGGLL